MHLPRTAAGAIAQATLVVLLAAFGLIGPGAGAAAADGGVSWVLKTDSNSFGADRPNYGYTLNPGGRLEDGLVIVNNGTTPLHLAVYAADGFTDAKGKLDLVAKDAKSTKVGAWVHPDQPDVMVQPGKTVKVPFTVTLPNDTAPGDYMGGVVTSPTPVGATAQPRLGIRIRLRVGGALKPSLAVVNLSMRYSGTLSPFGKADATVTYTIRNTGNAILGARQAVTVSGLFGHSSAAARQIADSPQLLPGDTWKVSVPVTGVASAPRLTAKVTLVPLLTDAAGSIDPLAAAETTTHAWTIMPWALLVLALVVLCGIIVAVATRRRRQAEPREDAPAEDAVEVILAEQETSDH